MATPKKAETPAPEKSSSKLVDNTEAAKREPTAAKEANKVELRDGLVQVNYK